MNRDKVILVDLQDNELGLMDKLEAHEKGLLHRAFSVFIFNDKKEILLQQRAMNKYHGAGLWTNACCSHPQRGETLQSSAEERLKYEMGIEVMLEKCFSFVYKINVENGLIEHEFDHVFTGKSNLIPQPNSEEVAAFKWMDVEELKLDILCHPQHYTYWFKYCLHEVLASSSSQSVE